MRDTESRYWEHMTPACMTEESDAENAEKIVTHQLLWRSECELMHKRERVYVCMCMFFRNGEKERVREKRRKGGRERERQRERGREREDAS